MRSLIASFALLILCVGCPPSNTASKTAPVTRSVLNTSEGKDSSVSQVPPASARNLEISVNSGKEAKAKKNEQQTNQSQAAEHEVAPNRVGEAGVAESMLPDSVEHEVSQTWTTQRIICLGTKGPVIVDLSVNVGGRSMEEIAQATIEKVAAQIATDLKKPWPWTELLDHRLVKSGWLGNLMPQQDQRDQLIGMYDKDGDHEVDDEELAAFLTRGLARGATLRFTEAASSSDSMQTSSPWGQLDVDADNQLDKSELQSVAENASRYDVNGDQIVTRAELLGMQATDANSLATSLATNSRTMLDSITAIPLSPDQKPSQIAGQVLQHYTFLTSVQRDQWPAWSEAAWTELDIDGDRQLTKSELAKLNQVQPHLVLQVSLPAPSKQERGKLTAMVSASSNLVWASRVEDTGHANRKDFVLAVAIVDNYTASTRQTLRAQLSAALNNPQIEALIRDQLQLGEEAFKLLDADEDKQLSDDEFEQVWGWLTSIRGTRAIARWSTSTAVWFELADHDGDHRVTELELQGLVELLQQLDHNQDGFVTPNEMPMTNRLEVTRIDDRLAGFNVNQQSSVADVVAHDWFSAMDTNGDEFVSNAEFIGSKEDFFSYDSDKDGFITRQEGFTK